MTFQENHQRKILEEKRLKREAAKREAEAKKRKKQGGNKSPPSPEPEDGCIIDNLLKEIRTGTSLKSSGRTSTIRRKKANLSSSDLGKLNNMVARAATKSSTRRSMSKSPSKSPTSAVAAGGDFVFPESARQPPQTTASMLAIQEKTEVKVTAPSPAHDVATPPAGTKTTPPSVEAAPPAGPTTVPTTYQTTPPTLPTAVETTPPAVPSTVETAPPAVLATVETTPPAVKALPPAVPTTVEATPPEHISAVPSSQPASLPTTTSPSSPPTGPSLSPLTSPSPASPPTGPSSTGVSPLTPPLQLVPTAVQEEQSHDPSLAPPTTLVIAGAGVADSGIATSQSENVVLVGWNQHKAEEGEDTVKNGVHDRIQMGQTTLNGAPPRVGGVERVLSSGSYSNASQQASVYVLYTELYFQQ